MAAAPDSPPLLLQRAVELATADIDAAGPTGGVVSYERSAEADDAWLVWVVYPGGGTGFTARAGAEWPTLLAWVADNVQEAYIDTFWQTRPRCPFHGHPLRPINADGEAVWSCPAGEWRRPIGSLANDAEYLAAIQTQGET